MEGDLKAPKKVRAKLAKTRVGTKARAKGRTKDLKKAKAKVKEKGRGKTKIKAKDLIGIPMRTFLPTRPVKTRDLKKERAKAKAKEKAKAKSREPFPAFSLSCLLPFYSTYPSRPARIAAIAVRPFAWTTRFVLSDDGDLGKRPWRRAPFSHFCLLVLYSPIFSLTSPPT